MRYVLFIAINLVANFCFSQDSTAVVKLEKYKIPKYSIKFSPLHIFGEHPFNRNPSFNIGIEQRLKNESNTLYHEIGVFTNRTGLNAEKIIVFFTDDSFGNGWEENVISNSGFRVREQFRSYIKKKNRAFVFIGVEAYYNYQNTEISDWGWVNDNSGGYGINYSYNLIKTVAGINPIFGFSFFSKKEEFKNDVNKVLNHIIMDLYVGIGMRLVMREFRNVPEGITFWNGNEFFNFSAFDDEIEGNYFSPGITFGLKIGYIISK